MYCIKMHHVCSTIYYHIQLTYFCLSFRELFLHILRSLLTLLIGICLSKHTGNVRFSQHLLPCLRTSTTGSYSFLKYKILLTQIQGKEKHFLKGRYRVTFKRQFYFREFQRVSQMIRFKYQ